MTGAAAVATLRGDRLVLDALGEGDIDSIVAYCQDPLFERWLTTPWPYRREHAEQFVRELVPGGWADGSECTWAIRRDEDGEGGGSGELLGVIGWRARGDVGFWMGEAHRGNGYMTEALGLVVDWAFAQRGVDEVRWESLIGNTGSAMVARASGFRFTGIGPLSEAHRDGTIPDGWQGALRRDDPRGPVDGWPL